MPWSHTSPMDQKTQFIADYLRDRLSMTELCELYGVSRKTGYKWIDRDLIHGPQGLEERSRRPSTSPRHTPDHVVAAILDARRRHPSWGAKKLLSILCNAIPAGPGRHARPSVTSSAATAWCPRSASAASSGILANPPAH